MPRCRKVLVSYGSSCESIGSSILELYPHLKIDECYTLSQRDLKYTLMHSQVRLVRSTISAMLKDVEMTHGIKCSPVFGYDGISMGDEIDSHPGFKLMVEHMNSKSHLFSYWMSNGSLETNARGLLYRYLPRSSTGTLSKSQLLSQNETLLRQYEIMLQENKMLQEKTAMMETLQIQAEELKRENEALRSEISSLRFKLEIVEIANRPRRKRQEPEAATNHPTETQSPSP